MEPLYSKKQVSELLQISDKTLDLWTSKGFGPKPIYLGRLVRFRKSDVEAFVELLSEEKGDGKNIG